MIWLEPIVWLEEDLKKLRLSPSNDVSEESGPRAQDQSADSKAVAAASRDADTVSGSSSQRQTFFKQEENPQIKPPRQPYSTKMRAETRREWYVPKKIKRQTAPIIAPEAMKYLNHPHEKKPCKDE